MPEPKPAKSKPYIFIALSSTKVSDTYILVFHLGLRKPFYWIIIGHKSRSIINVHVCGKFITSYYLKPLNNNTSRIQTLIKSGKISPF